ncbi:retrovirus-related pol polyprotein from transposon TNT 1-94 [Tanacetum coccineum]|uniref:Retrovirus-related pol polyprotein from transposon TNT 1-94 n=1 Tax=Tanacetum coccineum TaxID=301880 RepID=A0ABQ4YGU8_9ASTR
MDRVTIMPLALVAKCMRMGELFMAIKIAKGEPLYYTRLEYFVMQRNRARKNYWPLSREKLEDLLLVAPEGEHILIDRKWEVFVGSAHRILHNLFKSSIQATMSGEATKSGDKLQTFNLHVKANDIKQNKTHLTCGNCGMSRHTTDQCFELIGYPDWWNDGHKKGNKNRGLERGKASAANTGTDRKNSTGLGGMAATTVNEEDGSFSMSTTQNYNINQKQSWIFDCGATDTMTYDLSDFATSTKPTKSYIHTANGEKMNVRNGGTIEISPTLKLSNCLYVPALSHKLLSISHVTKELNCSVIMQPTFCILQDIRTGAIIGRGTERQGLYYVDELTTSGTVMLAHGTSEREAWLWHRRLGHPSGSYLHTLFPKLFPLNKPISCETCILAKSHRQTFKPSNTRVKVPFSLIHSDVWGPAPVIGGQSFRYYVIFVDDCTRMTWIYFLKNKAEVYDRFTAFYAMIQTQFQKSIQVVRSDNGGEYMNSQMNLFFQSKGIVHQTTCPHTPEQNGVAERKNRLLLEMTRALIIESNAPNFFWPEALATATYLINRLPTKILKMKTPLETLSEYHTLPQVLTLEPKVFGCTVFAHIPKSYRDKLDPCAEKCVFVGYGVNQKGYRCYNPKTRHMITTINCDFLETKYFYSSQHSVQGERECIDTLSWLSYGTHEGGRNHSTHNESPFSTQPEDPNVSDAQEAPNLIPEVSNTHSSPMSEPIETTNNTSGQDESIQEQEVFATQNDTNVEQNEHIEEQVNFPTQKDTSGRYVLPPRANRGVPPKRYSPEKVSRGSRYPIANIAKGNLSEEAKAFALSMYSDEIPANTEQKRVLPPGKKTVGCRWVFTIKYKPDGTIERYKTRLVAKGHTQTYGIDYSETFSPVAKINTIRVLISIAANKGWPLHQFDVKNAFLHGELKEEIYMEAPRGFTDSFGERERGNLITCLIIYVDDMIITGNDKEEITKLKKNLFTEFEMKDLGRLKYFLGIEVLRSKQGIFMYQKKYVLDLLAEIGMVDCKPADTPMIVNQKLYMEKKARLADKGRYQRMVGKLIYLSHTRPDIAHAVGVESKFMHQPQKAHMKVVLRIIRYLNGTAGHRVLFKQNGHLKTQLYTDADWAGDKGDRRSTLEAEFRGIARGITEVLWIRKLLTEIGYPPQEPSKVMSDNKATIQISENPVQHDRTKHIEIDRHFIKEKLEAEVITLPFIRSQDQLADILTKAVNERTLHECLGKLNFGNPTIQLEGECSKETI